MRSEEKKRAGTLTRSQCAKQIRAPNNENNERGE